MNLDQTSVNTFSDIVLAVAPMEGVMDHTMRSLLSQIGGMNYLVSEFVRVSQQAVSSAALKKLVPELNHNAKTTEGCPVHIQLLGSNPEIMGETAYNAVCAGASHIDINFGCPAKRVNGHGGGSFLLQSPNTLFEIVDNIRTAIPSNIPLSAKIRLGFMDESLFFQNLEAIEKGGANALTIHGRTKKDGYGPPARWEKIKQAKSNSNMTIIANGDIRSQESLTACVAATHCKDFMIGRGSLSNPFIFRELKEGNAGSETELLDLIENYIDTLLLNYDEFATLGRIKQWCAHLRQSWPCIANQLKTIRQTQSTSELKTLFAEMKIYNEAH
ncbi:tRNA dihydrouridine synthase [Marinomonas piezotolerans]|uniref:tRNA dihydrouridine synthase n=1 Tax=Marinomonas piezotolerans TaxID=2213058 RepID=UPI001FE550E5|nr:tRNA-dihydrouridine synthase family protein [Marinomonas piezotolerans]